jgi:hypothetical protein
MAKATEKKPEKLFASDNFVINLHRFKKENYCFII